MASKAASGIGGVERRAPPREFLWPRPGDPCDCENPRYLLAWYNRCSPEERWEKAIRGAMYYCSNDPRRGKPDVCRVQRFKGKIPPRDAIPPQKLKFPVVKKEPQFVSACNMWKYRPNECRESQGRFGEEWRCVPLEGFVEDHCPGVNKFLTHFMGANVVVSHDST
ncbi:OLC1v1014855C1 [Oldenlandia corymbosa var. corymbosa]|uniref:OLC1v1014855C1 n=1 Tax=Oldenlandia corymbosa var. corymbosa TaxID=529605 RepID=A0AAV1E5K5_OLDCO|nr:OLC1v1014855C1 [Oldenlandia corymbosa var. corymbosa]